MTEYRKKLYTNYFTNQAGRGFVKDQKKKFDEEEYYFTKEILKFMPENRSAKILDIGCGTGSFLSACKNYGYNNIEGIDVSEEMVKIANEFGISEAKCGDLNEFLAGKNGCYDVITGMDIIEHFTKDELMNLLETIKRSLKPYGIAVFRTPNVDAAFGTLYANGDFTHENYLNKNSATQLMLAMGFKDLEVLPSYIEVKGFLKELLRKYLWSFYVKRYKMELFASGRSSSNILFTPNMIIIAKNNS